MLKFVNNPKIPVATGGEPEFPVSTQDETLFSCSNSRGIPTCLSQLERRHDVLRQNEVFPEVPKATLSFLPQLEKNYGFHLNMRLGPFPCSALRAILSSHSKIKRRLDSLYGTHKVPQNTHRNSSGTLNIQPQLEKRPVFPN